MKKLAITLLGLAVLAIIVILIGIYASEIIPKAPINSTDIALKLALGDQGVREVISRNDNQYSVIVREINDSSTKGFIGYPGHLTGIYIESRSPSGLPPGTFRYYFIVDTDRKAIVDSITELDMAGPDAVTIPAGSAWYCLIASSHGTMFGGTPRTFLNASYTPADAKIFLIVASKEGLYALMNDSRDKPLRDLNLSRYVIAYNGTIPRGSGWNTMLTWPAVEAIPEPGVWWSNQKSYLPDNDYYFVVVNEEQSRDISLLLRAFPYSFW